MNERIRELKGKTLDKHFSYTWTTMDYDDVSKFAEKFAELIVQECVAQCWTVSEIEHKGYVISECSKRMRKHFGVEE